jgi:hypothetical protein
MKESARYVKIVEWSDEDGCYVGSSPGLLLGGCHGDDVESLKRRSNCITKMESRYHHQRQDVTLQINYWELPNHRMHGSGVCTTAAVAGG